MLSDSAFSKIFTERSRIKVEAIRPLPPPSDKVTEAWLAITELDVEEIKVEALREPDLNLMTSLEKLMTC